MLSALALAAACLVSCGSPAPSPTSTSTPPLPVVPSLLPLPANVSGIPADDEFTVEIAAHTPPGELAPGVPRNFTLGHCGLMSPIDIDGSLWDPIGGHNGQGGPLSQDHEGELINATPVIVVLTDSDTMEFATPLGAVITLARHDGPRRYFLCD